MLLAYPNCTAVWLKPAANSKVITLAAEFMIVGICVRASPCIVLIRSVIYLIRYDPIY